VRTCVDQSKHFLRRVLQVGRCPTVVQACA
jgi:hypothetical protein